MAATYTNQNSSNENSSRGRIPAGARATIHAEQDIGQLLGMTPAQTLMPRFASVTRGREVASRSTARSKAA